MNRHELKSWPVSFARLLRSRPGDRVTDTRDTLDRTFLVGDMIVFREWDPNRPPFGRVSRYTGRALGARVCEVLPSPFANTVELVLCQLEPFAYANSPLMDDHARGSRCAPPEHNLGCASYRDLQALHSYLVCELAALRCLVMHPPVSPAPSAVGLTVAKVVGGFHMEFKLVPPLEISDVQRVKLTLAPKLPDGSVDPGPFQWQSSNEAVATLVGTVAADDARVGTVDTTIRPDGSLVQAGDPDPLQTTPAGPTAWALTPSGPGTTTITVSSASPLVDANQMELTVTEGSRGNVNLSAGDAVSDL